jgi:hypothetical protein
MSTAEYLAFLLDAMPKYSTSAKRAFGSHMIVHSRKELAYFETGILVIQKSKLIIMTGTGEQFLFSKT